MAHLFVGNSLWHLIMQSDWVCKGVLLILFGMSVVCWTIFLYKLLALRAKRSQLMKVAQDLKHIKSLDEVVALSVRSSGTVSGYFLNQSMTHLKSLMEKQKSLSADDKNAFTEFSFQMVDDIIVHEESYLPFLSGSAAVSPLLGLFGTVWGLIHAFVGISEKQNADIATVAPGIAEALITTLAGIVVAVPALVMFIYLASQVKKLEHQYSQLAERLSQLVNRFVG